MRHVFLPLIFLTLLQGCDSTSSIKNPATSYFVRFYGQDGDQTGRDFAVLPDGSLVLFGTSRPTLPTKGTQWYVVRTDANGQVLWEREFGGKNNEEARDIELTTSGNLVLAGNTYDNNGFRDIMVITVTQDGAKVDSATIVVRDISGVPTVNKDEDVSSITEISDGFLIAGTSTYVNPGNTGAVPSITDSHDALKVRVYTNLTVYPNSWLQVYGKYSDDGSARIVPAPAGGFGNFYAFGYSNTVPLGVTPNYNFWYVILGVNGDPINDVTFSGAPSADEKMTSVAPTPSGYFTTGLLQSSTATSDVFITEASLPDAINGFVLSKQKTLSINLGTSLSGHTSVYRSVVSGGYFVLAEEDGFDNNQNWVLTRVNNDGSLGWTQPIIFGGAGFDECGAVAELADGKIILIGTMRTGRPDAGEFKMTLIKVSREGKFEN